MKERISARLSTTAITRLEALMEVYKCNRTEALEAAILSAKVESKPQTEQVYHAEVSPHNDMVKCPIGEHKGHWVRQATCRKCEETQCDIKR